MSRKDDEGVLRRVRPLREVDRVWVRKRNPGEYDGIPKLVVDYVAGEFQRGGWPIKRTTQGLVMNTILRRYLFKSVPDAPDRVQVTVWDKRPNCPDADYSRMKPQERFQIRYRR